jgi:hypothetical protein
MFIYEKISRALSSKNNRTKNAGWQVMGFIKKDITLNIKYLQVGGGKFHSNIFQKNVC